MYLQFFGFSQRPFAASPDPAFLYRSRQYDRAVDVILKSVDRHVPIVLVTGDIGTGKTTLLRTLLPQIAERGAVALPTNVVGDGRQLLRWILSACGDDARPSTLPEMVDAFVQRSGAAEVPGRRSIVILDEAQNISDEGLRTVALLGDRGAAKEAPLSILLVGQPRLRERVEASGLSGLTGRIGASFHLVAMTLSETEEYVRTRTSRAGGDPAIFASGAIAAIHQAGGGVPRRVNQLCEMCLVSALGAGRRRVEAAFAEAVLAESLAHDGSLHVSSSAASAMAPPRVAAATSRSPGWDAPVPQRQRTLAAPEDGREAATLSPGVTEHEREEGGEAPMAAVLRFTRPLRLGQRPGTHVAAVAAAACLAAFAPAYLREGAGTLEFVVSSDVGLTSAIHAALPPRNAVPLPTVDPERQAGEAHFRRALDVAPRDPARAAVEYARAAARGHKRAAYYLAQLYDAGDGVARSPHSAAAWYAVAADAIPAAAERLQRMAPVQAAGLHPVEPRFSALAGGMAELVWEGAGPSLVEFAAAPGQAPLSSHATPLTAALLRAPENARWWRVRSPRAVGTDWLHLAPPAGDVATSPAIAAAAPARP